MPLYKVPALPSHAVATVEFTYRFGKATRLKQLRFLCLRLHVEGSCPMKLQTLYEREMNFYVFSHKDFSFVFLAEHSHQIERQTQTSRSIERDLRLRRICID